MNNAITRLKRKSTIFILIVLISVSFFSNCRQAETTNKSQHNNFAFMFFCNYPNHLNSENIIANIKSNN